MVIAVVAFNRKMNGDNVQIAKNGVRGGQKCRIRRMDLGSISSRVRT
jgi:hypothetical protein